MSQQQVNKVIFIVIIKLIDLAIPRTKGRGGNLGDLSPPGPEAQAVSGVLTDYCMLSYLQI